MADKRICVLALKNPVKTLDFPDEAAAALKKRFPDVDFHAVPFHPQKIEHLDEAEILYAYTITPALLSSAPNLKWFHAVITGPDTYTFPEIIKRKITVTSPRGVYSAPMSESIIGMMLALTRKIREGIIAQSKGQWAAVDICSSHPAAGELNGSTVAIVGMGGIGNATAERCRALGMNVTGIIRDTFSDLKDALKKADFLVLACPLTKETRGMIGAKELSSMKKTAYLINIARGELVDEAALIDALKTKKIGGAACDVFSTEPLPAGHPFYSAPNMIVMPHISGFSSRFWERAVVRFAENLEKYLKGEALIGAVDFERGY
jgi:phosphoglycerate dehydrogenase-like enzyme